MELINVSGKWLKGREREREPRRRFGVRGGRRGRGRIKGADGEDKRGAMGVKIEAEDR